MLRIAGTAVATVSTGCLYPLRERACTQLPGQFTTTSKRITRQNATIVARTPQQLASAITTGNATVWIPGDAVFDMSSYEQLYIAPDVTIASNRGIGDSGALLKFDSTGHTLFSTASDRLRISGVRFKGPRTDFYDPGESGAIRDNTKCFIFGGNQIVVDNCELYGWQKAALHFQGSPNQQSWVHHNYIHHNQMQHRGYGIDLVTGQHLIEWNLFNANRHAITGTGFPSVGYTARYNVQGPKTIYQPFDMHSAAEVQPENYDPPLAGKFLNLHHNVPLTTHSVTVGIRGVPAEKSAVHDNWFAKVPTSPHVPMSVIQQQIDRTETDIIHLAQYRNLTVTRNQFGKRAAKKGIQALKQAAKRSTVSENGNQTS